MAAPMKQPPKKGGWGSMLSSAVAGLESRLDTILADGPDGGAKKPTTEDDADNSKDTAASGIPPVPAAVATASLTVGGSTSRDASRSRTNDRLAERLARATAQRSRGSQQNIPRTQSPVKTPSSVPGSSRTSIETKRQSSDVQQEGQEEVSEPQAANGVPPEIREDSVEEQVADQEGKSEELADTTPAAGTLLTSTLPINPARVSIDSARPSIEISPGSDGLESTRPSAELNGNGRSAIELEAEMERLQADHEEQEKQRQEEMHAHLERIDALQAKLQYLAKETVAAAKQANAAMTAGTPEAKLAQKDEQIALLMEEGQQLSKTELRHLQTIKKLRAKGTEDEKALLDMRKKLDKAERSEMEQKHKVRRAEASERQAVEKSKQIAVLEKQLDILRQDRDRNAEQVTLLTTQLQEAEKRAAKAIEAAQNKALEADKNKIADLENELEDAQIEKKLAEDRAQAEVKKVREDTDRQRERWAVTELELVNEIKAVEARLEAMRARAEEATTEGEGGESSAKLLRQIELLQNQYNVAKTNSETIEGSLNARLVAMEKDRDEASRREADARRKARETASKARKAAEEVESSAQQIRDKDAEIQMHQTQTESLQRTVRDAESALADAKSDLDRQRRIWESELTSRLEEEKARWQRGTSTPRVNRNDSAPMSRKTSGIDIVLKRGPPKLDALNGYERPGNNQRRPSVQVPLRNLVSSPDREMSSSPFGMQESMPSIHDLDTMPQTPSFADADDDFDHVSSPHQTINDIVSTTVSGAGPSVQLVERMSAAVRRLEAEKAAHKDEMARLGAQRDEARDQIVALMREVEEARASKSRVSELEKESLGVQQRYDACLEMLGEREEEVDELKADVVELKKMYRELVEEKVGA